MKLLHGIDITNLDRIEFNNQQLINRFLHQDELIQLSQLDNEKSIKRFVASHWAIKEAIFKALSGNINSFKNINIKYINHRPIFELEKYDSIISVSYENNLVIASVILVLLD